MTSVNVFFFSFYCIKMKILSSFLSTQICIRMCKNACNQTVLGQHFTISVTISYTLAVHVHFKAQSNVLSLHNPVMKNIQLCVL